MNKPLLVERAEFTEKVVALVNNSNLPAVILLPIIENVAKELSALINTQYEQEKIAYQNAINEEVDSDAKENNGV